MLQRGEANTRWRDFADVVAIAARHQMSEAELLAALDVVSTHRRALFEPLASVLNRMPIIAQSKWTTWRNRQENREAIPEFFADALDRTAALVDPIVGATALDRNWDPTSGLWR